MIKIKLIKLVSVFAILFCFQATSSFAGAPIGGFWSEDPSGLLMSYFDTRNRRSYVQVTNTSSTNPALLHVQIFADLNTCEDRDFSDSLTPNETHVYDISNLQSANGNPINFAIPADSHGYVIITSNRVPGPNNPNPNQEIVGNFRIVDNSGYEYRVNSVQGRATDGPSPERAAARFSDNWGANQADIVGVRIIAQGDLPDGTSDLTVEIAGPVELFMYDDEETGTSCGEVILGCDEIPGNDDGDGGLTEFSSDFINQGINDIFVNSRGGLPLCSGDFNTDGYVRLTEQMMGGQPFRDFVGFAGFGAAAGFFN